MPRAPGRADQAALAGHERSRAVSIASQENHMVTANSQALATPPSRTRSTDEDWERFAQTHPYFAVITDERFKGSELAGVKRETFFVSGQHHIDYDFHVLRSPFRCPERIHDALQRARGVL